MTTSEAWELIKKDKVFKNSEAIITLSQNITKPKIYELYASDNSREIYYLDIRRSKRVFLK